MSRKYIYLTKRFIRGIAIPLDYKNVKKKPVGKSHRHMLREKIYQP